jgi:hypothetical protein
MDIDSVMIKTGSWLGRRGVRKIKLRIIKRLRDPRSALGERRYEKNCLYFELGATQLTIMI